MKSPVKIRTQNSIVHLLQRRWFFVLDCSFCFGLAGSWLFAKYEIPYCLLCSWLAQPNVMEYLERKKLSHLTILFANGRTILIILLLTGWFGSFGYCMILYYNCYTGLFQRIGHPDYPDDLQNIVLPNLFSCPGQLNRWPCHSLINWLTD